MKPKIKTTCTKLQLHLLSFCLLCLSGKTRCDGNGPAVVKVEQDSDAVLPCSLSSTENIESYRFEWKKAAQIDGRQKEVFFYDAGITYDSGRSGQSEEFKGRVSHFQDELKQGNASIIIRNTKMADSGDYTCDFPRLQPPQTFHIKLVVGTCPKPYLRILRPTTDGMLLQCVVRGASPKPKVEWKDSSGKILLAEEPQVTDRGGLYDIILQTTVTKTDNYSCVSTQEEICHQISDDTHVSVNVERGNSGSGANSSDPPTGRTGVVVGVIVTLVCTLLVVGVVLAVLFYKRHIILNRNNGSPADHKEGSVVPLKSQPSRSEEAPDPET